ncbi:hypothetical protein O7632_26460 [Solwaraspora sp. WMMD406]|uniref:hypothetical protein n=1 Tax=Solwaraspora sp. WMMD406 TaxID=3016095 RepID=UPI0024175CF6|nr:hypothetical protein [Solwaraspora sp. WMMD406]MDG4767608.1 hypothetical protein [Solwaraspora sp. WMMD406]
MIIPARFNGPPGSANGGYAAGLFAQALLGAAATEVVADRPVRVTLRRPPPLDVELSLVPVDGEALRVHAPAGSDPVGELIAEVEATGPGGSAPVAPVSVAEAESAGTAYPGFVDHPFPGCYVCGPRRADGLRIFPGPVADGRSAASFVMPDDPTVATVWAALDCPGGWTVLAVGRPYVLGRITATVAALPTPGQPYVVVGSLIATSGRKAEVRTALYGPADELLGAAEATWIAVPPPTQGEPV